VRGTYDGRDVTIHAVFGTVSISVPIATRDDLLLEIQQRSWLTDEALEVHDTVEVLTGDSAFDKAFHVEGAPTDVVLASLTAEVRQHLLTYPRCGVELTDEALVERHRARSFDVAALEPRIRAVLAFARGIEHARAEVPKLRALPTHADGFRDTPQTALGDHAELELAQLAEMRKSRNAILIPASMIAALAAYLVAVFVIGMPLVFLLLALPAALVGGIALSLVLSAIGRVTGITKALGKARVRALAASQDKQRD
jgi:hypothetical protein